MLKGIIAIMINQLLKKFPVGNNGHKLIKNVQLNILLNKFFLVAKNSLRMFKIKIPKIHIITIKPKNPVSANN